MSITCSKSPQVVGSQTLAAIRVGGLGVGKVSAEG